MDRLIAFDLDDTLVAEALFLRSGIRHVARLLRERFPELPPLRFVNRMDAAVMRHTNHYSALESLLAEMGLRESVDMAEIVAEFRSHRPDPDIYHLPLRCGSGSTTSPPPTSAWPSSPTGAASRSAIR